MPKNEADVPAGRRYRHPLAWYDVAIPPGWAAEPDSDPVRITGPDGEAVAVISIAKTSDVVLPRARSRYLRRAVRGMVVIERQEEEEGRRDGLTWARAEELLAKKVPWYKRLFSHPHPEVVLITVCYTRGPLLALLTVEAAPDTLERHRLMIGAMANSLQLAEHPALTPPEFVERFVELASARFPEHGFTVAEPPLTASVDGVELSLEQFYRSLLYDPAQGDEVYEAVFRYLEQNPVPAPGSESFDEVADRILPAIKPRSWVETTDAKLPERHKLLWMPFPNDTAVVFVIDYEAAMRFVSKDEAERWETPPKQMLRLARENLGRHNDNPKQHLILTKEGIPHALAVTEGDGYDAARLLLPDLRARLAEHFGDSFAIAIPNRDFLIAFRTDMASVLRQVRRLIEQDSSRRPYPITDALFHFTDKGIESYEGRL